MPLVPRFVLRLAPRLLVAALPVLTFAAPPPIPTTPAKEIAHPASIALWPKGAPGFEAKKDVKESVDWRQEPDIVFPVTSGIHNPSITPYLPAKGKATGAAVIIAPGGGHMFLTMDREGYDLGQWLADHGVAAFVLKYRLARDQSNPKDGTQPYSIDGQALGDAQRAIRVIRARAKEWGVNPAHVGILGFSAGGEVALLAATRFDSGKSDSADPIERESSRPDFFAPVYPGGLQRTDVAPRKDTPPAFLLCAVDDRMPEQLATYLVALKKAGVNAELHIYNSGGHGFGVRDRPIAVSRWPQRFVEWMADLGFLKS